MYTLVKLAQTVNLLIVIIFLWPTIGQWLHFYSPFKLVVTSPTLIQHNELTTSVDQSICCEGVLARLYNTKFKG